MRRCGASPPPTWCRRAVPGPVHEFVARAEAAGVQRLVLLSGHGADTLGRLHVRAGHALGRGRRARLGAGVDRAAAVQLRPELRRGPLPRPAGRRRAGAPGRCGPRAVHRHRGRRRRRGRGADRARPARRADLRADRAARDDLRRGRRADLPGVRAAHHLQADLPRRVHRGAGRGRVWARTTPTTSPRCSC